MAEASVIQGILQEVLGVPRITYQDNLLALGIDSIKGMAIAGKLEAVMHVSVPLPVLLGAKDVDEFMSLLEGLVTEAKQAQHRERAFSIASPRLPDFPVDLSPADALNDSVQGRPPCCVLCVLCMCTCLS